MIAGAGTGHSQTLCQTIQSPMGYREFDLPETEPRVHVSKRN
jgi:hypothetical protein